ncbi:MAG: AAA family ATPase [Acidimicrobiia bacterium]
MATPPASETPVELEAKLRAAFTPHSPISRPAVFRGRISQIRASIDAMASPGLHVVLYGERGVGKTSLASVLTQILKDVQAHSRVICSRDDTFSKVMKRALHQIALTNVRAPFGFTGDVRPDGFTLADAQEPQGYGPDEIATTLTALPPLVVLVFDEFDRLTPEASAPFADLIKSLSDRGSTATIVLVGVASDVGELLSNHQSVSRCLRQISIPRMSDGEVAEIIDLGMKSAGFSFRRLDTRAAIIDTAQGFPYYAHLLSLYAGQVAVDDERSEITTADFQVGLKNAVAHADQGLRDEYYQAVAGTKKTNMWREVVLACAVAEADDRGYFSSRSVQDSLSQILNREVIQQTVAFHLGKLTENSRGPLLHRIGPERRYRYNFANPLIRPFIKMQAAVRRLEAEANKIEADTLPFGSDAGA